MNIGSQIVCPESTFDLMAGKMTPCSPQQSHIVNLTLSKPLNAASVLQTVVLPLSAVLSYKLKAELDDFA